MVFTDSSLPLMMLIVFLTNDFSFMADLSRNYWLVVPFWLALEWRLLAQGETDLMIRLSWLRSNVVSTQRRVRKPWIMFLFDLRFWVWDHVPEGFGLDSLTCVCISQMHLNFTSRKQAGPPVPISWARVSNLFQKHSWGRCGGICF